MMNGHERSGSVVVAAKPANKAAHPAVEQSTLGPAAAELGEPRTEAEGNADQQSTCRAQNRVSVSHALERIRKVARERKKERFTALFHHLKAQQAPPIDRRRLYPVGAPELPPNAGNVRAHLVTVSLAHRILGQAGGNHDSHSHK